MTTEEQIGIRVTSKSDDAALRDAEKSIKRLGDTAKNTGGMFTSLATAAKGIMASLGAILAATEVIQFLKRGASAAMEKEEALTRLSKAAIKYGQDGKAAAEGALALGNALEKAGFDDIEVIQGVQQLMRYTQDYSQALSAVALAAKYSKAEQVPLNEALSTMSMLLMGTDRSVMMALRNFGIEAKTAQEALDKMHASYKDTSFTLDTEKSKWKALGEEIGNIAEAIGGPLASALLAAINIIKSLPETALTVVATVWAEVRNVPQNIADGLKGEHQKIVDREIETLRTIEKLRQEWKGRMDAIWSPKGPDIKIPEAPRTRGGGDGDALKERAALLKSIATQMTTLYPKMATAAEREAQAQAEASKKVQESLEERFAVERALLNEEERIAAERKQIAAADVEIERQKTDAKIALRQAEQDAVLGIAAGINALFGENKAVAVAMTIVETYVAAQSAYARVMETPGLMAAAPALAAAAAASAVLQGMARVKAILEVEPGSGGGRAGGASMGGGTSRAAGGSYSNTMASPYNPNAGFATRGASQGPDQGSTTTTNHYYTANALTGSDAVETLRKMEKKRVRANRSYKRGVANRGSITIGRA